MAKSRVHKIEGKLRRGVLVCEDLDSKTMGQTAGWPLGIKREQKLAKKKRARRDAVREENEDERNS